MAHPTHERGARRPEHPDITEELIRKLVLSFYDKVRNEPAIGPIFNAVIKDNWPHHLEKMCLFWGAVMLKTGAYKGRPVPKHVAIEDLSAEHFKIWLGLFRETAFEICGSEVAPAFIKKAETIAESLQLACFFNGQPAPLNAFVKGELQETS